MQQMEEQKKQKRKYLPSKRIKESKNFKNEGNDQRRSKKGRQLERDTTTLLSRGEVMQYNFVYSYQLQKSMSFLMNFFGTKKAAPKTKKTHKKTEPQLLNLDPSRTQELLVGNNMDSTQQKILKQTQPQQPAFHLQHEASLLQIKLLELNKVLSSKFACKLDFGYLVGLVNNFKHCKELIGDCMTVNIGMNEEINSLRFLRNNCLDSLIIFWNSLSCQFTLSQYLETSQRLFFVIDDWPTVKAFIHNYETDLFQKFGDSLLNCCSDKLMFNLISFKSRFILQFQDQKKFTKKFITRIKASFPDLGALNNLEEMINMMTLKEYQQCFKQKKIQLQALSKLEKYRMELERMSIEERKKEELAKIDLLLAAEKEEEYEIVPEPVRKNSSMEAEIEAEYFGKAKNQRESQKQTRVSGGSRLQDSEELYYFIEQHDESSNEEYSCNHNQQAQDSGRPSNSPPRIPRSKSWNSLSDSKPEELDDELFTKY